MGLKLVGRSKLGIKVAVVAATILVLATSVLNLTKVNAGFPGPDPKITSTVPPINTDGNGGGKIEVDISEACVGYPKCTSGNRQLNAPAAYAKLYFQDPDGEQATLYNGDPNQNYNPANVFVRFTATDQRERPLAGCDQTVKISAFKFNNGPQGANWSDPVDLDKCKPQQSVFTGYYTVQAIITFDDFDNPPQNKYPNNYFNSKLRAYCSTDSGGTQHGVCTNGGNNTSSTANLAGFWAQVNKPDSPMALEDKDFGSGSCAQDNCYDIWVGFGAPCKQPINSTLIQWNDADAKSAPQGNPANPEIYWELYSSTDGGNTWNIIDWLGPAPGQNPNDPRYDKAGSKRGANGDYRSQAIPSASPGTKYVWHWGGIVKNNDPQLWIPWDSINYALDCPSSPQWDLSADLSNPTCPSIVAPGDNCSIDAWIKNASSTETNDIEAALIVQDENSTGSTGQSDTNPINANGPKGFGYTGSATTCNADPSLPPPVQSRTPCWFWQYKAGILDSRQTTGTFSFKIPANAKAGDVFCFNAYAHPENDAYGEYVGTQHVCYTVELPRQPYLSTLGGSVHAGLSFSAGGTCFNAADPSNPGNGSITGVTNGSATGSLSSYVVSAGGAINDFGSNGTTGNSLTFGNTSTPNGYYGTICRDDVAFNLLSDSSGTNLGSGDQIVNLSKITKRSDIWQVGGPTNNATDQGDVTLHVNTRTIPKGIASTLVVNGDVYIDGSIGFDDSGYSKLTDIPSFAVVATGDIFIDPKVINLYGIYIAGSQALTPHSPGAMDANGDINTCQNGPAGARSFDPAITQSASQCDANLIVNGALIADGYYFRRTGGDVNSASGPAELINLIPQLMLHAPPGVIGLTQQLQYQGERPPVF